MATLNATVYYKFFHFASISVMFRQYEKHLKPITIDTEKKPYSITCVPLLVKRNSDTKFLSNDATLAAASIVSGIDKKRYQYPTL